DLWPGADDGARRRIAFSALIIRLKCAAKYAFVSRVIRLWGTNGSIDGIGRSRSLGPRLEGRRHRRRAARRRPGAHPAPSRPYLDMQMWLCETLARRRR